MSTYNPEEIEYNPSKKDNGVGTKKCCICGNPIGPYYKEPICLRCRRKLSKPNTDMKAKEEFERVSEEISILVKKYMKEEEQ